MITRDFIQKKAIKCQTSELNIAREYIQHLFLSFFLSTARNRANFIQGRNSLKNNLSKSSLF